MEERLNIPLLGWEDTTVSGLTRRLQQPLAVVGEVVASSAASPGGESG